MLSELRRGAGQPGYEVDIAEKLRQQFADGDLPVETACVKCGVTTEGVLKCSVECERTWARGGGYWKTFFLAVFVPWHHLRNDFRDPEVLGQERVVQTPIRLCDDCRYAMEKKPRKRQLVELLRTVPAYDQLFREYPNAEVYIA